MTNKTRFLSDPEKLNYYARIARVDTQLYPVHQDLKVFDGGEFLIYHFDKAGELSWDSVIMCTGISADLRGVRVDFINKSTYKLFTIADIPNRVFLYDLLGHVPYTCDLERTVKVFKGGRKIQSLNAQVTFLSKSFPSDRVPGHRQILPFNKITEMFTESEISLAVAKVEEKANV